MDAMKAAIFICNLLFIGSSAGSVLVAFEKTAECPVSGSNLIAAAEHTTGLIDCASQCTGLQTCNAFHFDRVNGSCLLGDACSTLTQWTAGNCDSYRYTDVSGGGSFGRSDLLSQLQMKLFYRFKKTGLVNEANPRQFCLTAHDVTIGSDGAEFKATTGSYLSVKTPGFEQYLDYGKIYSFFTQVRHAMASVTQYYHRFQQCVGTSASNTFAKGSGYEYCYSQWTTGGFQYRTSRTAAILPSDGQEYSASLGYAFNATVHQHFYFNGSLAPVDVQGNGPTGATAVDTFQCLTLGFSFGAQYCLNGTMQCYGMSTKVLDVSEFNALSDYCTRN